MSVIDEVLSSLRAMSQLQLLLAFVACTGYALAQGHLVPAKARRFAWTIALLAAIGFAFESSEWMHAAMLVGFAIVGLGLFVALAWTLSRVLGFSKPRALAEAVEFAASVDVADEDADAAADIAVNIAAASAEPARAAPAFAPHSGHAHPI